MDLRAKGATAAVSLVATFAARNALQPPSFGVVTVHVARRVRVFIAQLRARGEHEISAIHAGRLRFAVITGPQRSVAFRARAVYVSHVARGFAARAEVADEGDRPRTGIVVFVQVVRPHLRQASSFTFERLLLCRIEQVTICDEIGTLPIWR